MHQELRIYMNKSHFETQNINDFGGKRESGESAFLQNGS